MTDAKMEVRGLKETQKKMEQVIEDLRGAEFMGGMEKATLVVQRAAKGNLVGYRSPTVGGVDTGRLRASITPEVRAHGDVVQGVVGSNVIYAPFVELDTRPHWPPIGALETWARRHGATAFLVARAIARRGTYGKHYLERALKDNADRICQILGRVVSKIVVK